MKIARWLIPLAIVPLVAHAAPKPPYGGDITAYVFGPPPALAPAELATLADLTLQRGIYEPLYTIDAQGEVAPHLAGGLPEVIGDRVRVPIRRGVLLHDGRTLTPAHVVAALNALAAPGSRAMHVLLPVVGTRMRIAGLGPSAVMPAISVDAAAHAVVFELEAPYPDFARLLASPRAGIAVPSVAAGPAVGTGPWSVAERTERGEVTLAPFVSHSEGRPLLDRLEMRPHASRFGALSIARRGDAALVFDVPDPAALGPGAVIAWPKGQSAPEELVVLSVGRGLSPEDPTDLADSLGRALDRERLANRFLGPGATPASTLVWGIAASPSAPVQSSARVKATLLVPRDFGPGQRFAERVQLDLLRAGVTVVIERAGAEVLDARRRDRRYDLLLDTVMPDAPHASPADQLHGLLSVAAAFGRADVISADALTRFGAASAQGRRTQLVRLETEVRRGAGLVPIARRAPAVAVRRDLAGYDVQPSGAILLEGAYLTSDEAPATGDAP